MLAVCTWSASKNARRLGYWNFLTCSIFSQSPAQFLRSVPNSRTSPHTSPQNATSAFVFATFSVPASYEGTIAARSPALPRAAVPPPASARRPDRFAWNADSFIVDAASMAQGELVVSRDADSVVCCHPVSHWQRQSTVSCFATRTSHRPTAGVPSHSGSAEAPDFCALSPACCYRALPHGATPNAAPARSA